MYILEAYFERSSFCNVFVRGIFGELFTQDTIFKKLVFGFMTDLFWVPKLHVPKNRYTSK